MSVSSTVRLRLMELRRQLEPAKARPQHHHSQFHHLIVVGETLMIGRLAGQTAEGTSFMESLQDAVFRFAHDVGSPLTIVRTLASS